MTAATAPVRVPQKITTPRRGCSAPLELSDPITMEAASAPVTKKIATRTMARTMTADGEPARHAQVLDQVEECAVEVDGGSAVDHGHQPGRVGRLVGFLLDVEGGSAEDAEPDHADDAGHQQHAGDELADGAAAADAGDEHAYERRPGDPPGPVEDGPAGHPAPQGLVADRFGPGGHLGQVAGVVADGGGDQVEDEQGGSGDEDDEGQDDGQDHVDVGEPLDAAADAGDGRGDEAEGQDGDDHHEHGSADFAEPAVGGHAAADLQGAEAQGSGGAEEGGEDGQDVDELARPALPPS